MTWTVSISDFRNNLSDYLEKVRLGDDLVIKDEKKNEEIVEVKSKKFDQKKYAKDYAKMLQRVAGTFSAKNHPEWATIEKTEKWLRESRLADERKFDVYPG